MLSLIFFCLANISPGYDLQGDQNYDDLVSTNNMILCGIMNHTQIKSVKQILQSRQLFFLIKLEVIDCTLCTCLLYQTYLNWVSSYIDIHKCVYFIFACICCTFILIKTIRMTVVVIKITYVTA